MNYALQRNHLLPFLCTYITQTIAGSIRELSSTSTRVSTPSTESSIRRTFEFNLKVVATILACIIFVFIVIRLCVMACRSSRSSNNQPSYRRRSVVRPQVAVVEMNEFKPDLPPAYAEAVTNIDTDGSKLPSYEEVRREHT